MMHAISRTRDDEIDARVLEVTHVFRRRLDELKACWRRRACGLQALACAVDHALAHVRADDTLEFPELERRLASNTTIVRLADQIDAHGAYLCRSPNRQRGPIGRSGSLRRRRRRRVRARGTGRRGRRAAADTSDAPRRSCRRWRSCMSCRSLSWLRSVVEHLAVEAKEESLGTGEIGRSASRR